MLLLWSVAVMTCNLTGFVVFVMVVTTLSCSSALQASSSLINGTVPSVPTVSIVSAESTVSSVPRTIPANCKFYLLSEVQCVGEINLKDIAASSSAPELRKLSLVNCTLKSLPVDSFVNFKSLQQLRVSCIGLETTTREGAFNGLDRLETIYLRSSGLSELPPRIFCKGLPRLTSVLLSANRFDSDDKLGFDRTCTSTCIDSAAKFLDLSSNRLTMIHRTGFVCSLRKLIFLNLAHNRIVEVESDAFEHLVRLKRLTLANNSLSTLPHEIFRNLGALSRLDLALNRLGSVSFGHLGSLTILNLANNRIVALNDTLKNLRNLEELYLEKNELTTLESDVFGNLVKLKILDLGVNRIEFVSSDTFVPMTELRSLDLQRNRLKSVPNVSNNVNLETLRLKNNDIETIDEYVFERLERLQVLELYRNRIVEVDLTFFRNLKSLVRLFLLFNNISTVVPLDQRTTNRLRRGYRFPLSKLYYLDISHNNLTSFDFECLPYEVDTLALSRNAIASVRSDSIPSAVAVDTVDLGYNLLNTIETECVPSSTRTLFLMGNRITSVDEMAFKGFESLTMIDLSDNRLVTLQLFNGAFMPPSSHLFSNKKITLKLDSNPLRCDCHLKWLKEIVEDRQSISPYRVWDNPELWCQRLYSKGVASNVTIVNANRVEDYVCDFIRDDFSGMVCPFRCTCYEDLKRTVVIVECSNASLTEVPLNVPWPRLATSLFLDHNMLTALEDDAFEDVESVTVLHLQYNLLQSLSPKVFRNLSRLLELDLSHNRLRNLDYGELFESLGMLSTLQLHDNRIVSYPVWTMARELPSIEVLGLYNNPWSCDCNFALNFTDWIRSYIDKLPKSDSLYCTMDPESTNGTTDIPMLGFNASYCYTYQEAATTHAILNNSQIYALASSLCILVITVVSLLLVFLYRRELQVLVYSKYGIRVFSREETGEDDADKVYDVFVSYCSHDEEFVVRDLLPGLEQIDVPYRVCLHHRDFVVGAFITDNILEAVGKSRRTLLVMSQEFVRSGWCRFEFKTAHFQMLKDRCQRVIVVLLGEMPVQMDPEMKLYITTNTYLSWGDRLFWKKLYFAMPSTKLPARVPAE